MRRFDDTFGACRFDKTRVECDLAGCAVPESAHSQPVVANDALSASCRGLFAWLRFRPGLRRCVSPCAGRRAGLGVSAGPTGGGSVGPMTVGPTDRQSTQPARLSRSGRQSKLTDRVPTDGPTIAGPPVRLLSGLSNSRCRLLVGPATVGLTSGPCAIGVLGPQASWILLLPARSPSYAARNPPRPPPLAQPATRILSEPRTIGLRPRAQLERSACYPSRPAAHIHAMQPGSRPGAAPIVPGASLDCRGRQGG